MQYDAIIIGSGPGGPAAGAKLSKEGKKVMFSGMHQDLEVFEKLTFLKIPEFYRRIGRGRDG